MNHKTTQRLKREVSRLGALNLRAEIAALKAQEDEWRALVTSALALIQHIGWTSAERGDIILRAEKWIAKYKESEEDKP